MKFRTKARAVDLLGKGQIADLPTAITELWKNGYDAYADNLTAEIFLSGYKGLAHPCFMISDDGIGMSGDDIINKWLVLGIDFKSRSDKQDKEGEDTLYKKPRIKSGEKGIGRLSVAYLGSPMLMLTKKQGYPLQAMFFDWRLLENYNLYLDDISIPVEELTVESFKEKFELLKKSFLKNLEKDFDITGNKIWEDKQEKIRLAVRQSVQKANIPVLFEKEILKDFSDIKKSHGTKFIVFEPEEQILNLREKNEDEVDEKSFVRASFVGFMNNFKNGNKSQIKYNFFIHKESNEPIPIDFLNESGNFFNEKDYSLADIVIDGNLDGKGNFVGKLNIYNEERNYSFTSPRKKDNRSFYGNIPIKLGYSMGKKAESKLKGDLWDIINNKLEKYGGIYIYRDNFRVLPYGRANYDFVGIEERRNKRIGSAFFSYRRLFGYIELSRIENYMLKDKSSREGLINNSAYRAFRTDLSSLFIDLANEYFGDKAKDNCFLEAKKQLKEKYEIIKKDEKRELLEKKEFTKKLRNFSKIFEQYKKDYENIINKLKELLNKSNIVFSDIEEQFKIFTEKYLLYSELLPERPKRYKITEIQDDMLYECKTKFDSYEKNIKKDKKEIEKKLSKILAVKELQKNFVVDCNVYISRLQNMRNENSKSFDSNVSRLSNDISAESNNVIKEIEEKKENFQNKIHSVEDFFIYKNEMEKLFDVSKKRINEKIDPIVEHISKLSLNIDEEFLQGAYKEEYEDIKRKWEQVRETAQLGIAAEIIDHEFNNLYSQINHSLKKIKDDTPVFSYLKKSFKTLEDKYSLLSPLYRISGSSPKEIECKKLKIFLQDFFESKILRDNVSLISSEAFDKHIIYIREPVIHAVMINIINNALYWMHNAENKKIQLDYKKETEEIIIRNSGEMIKGNKLEKIFELFYSNRPNGRGIGLYLAKQSLNDNYFDIYATNDKNYNILNGACFVIKRLIPNGGF